METKESSTSSGGSGATGPAGATATAGATGSAGESTARSTRGGTTETYGTLSSGSDATTGPEGAVATAGEVSAPNSAAGTSGAAGGSTGGPSGSGNVWGSGTLSATGTSVYGESNTRNWEDVDEGGRAANTGAGRYGQQGYSQQRYGSQGGWERDWERDWQQGNGGRGMPDRRRMEYGDGDYAYGDRMRDQQGPSSNMARWRDQREPPASFGERGTALLNGRTLAATLGAVGIGLGIAQLLAPRTVAETIGVYDEPAAMNWLRACGLREIVTGVGLLVQPDKPLWMWGRVAGDAIDVALLTAAMRNPNNDNARLGAALGAVAGITMGDLFALDAVSRQSTAERSDQPAPKGIRVEKVITVNRTPEACYR